MIIRGSNGRLTAEAIEEIRKRVINDEPGYKVAKILGIPYPTVKYHIKDLPNFRIKNNKITDQTKKKIRNAVMLGFTKYECTEIFNVSYLTVLKYTKDLPGSRGKYLRLGTEKFLLNIMKEGCFIPYKGESQKALACCRILRDYDFKIKIAKLGYLPPVYFPKSRGEYAFKAFLKIIEKTSGKEETIRWLLPGIMRQFEIRKKDFKRVLRECGH